jgi:hypothetical protein
VTNATTLGRDTRSIGADTTLITFGVVYSILSHATPVPEPRRLESENASSWRESAIGQ